MGGIKLNAVKSTIIRSARAALGDRQVHAMLMRRNVKSYRDTGIAFVHIPKCAGTSISASLYGRSLGHHTAQTLMAAAGEEWGDFYSFAVVREPVSRAYSAWQYAVTGGTEKGFVKDREEYRSDSFATFETFATRWLPEQDLSRIDPIFQTQVSYVNGADGTCLVNRIVALGNLSAEWPDIASRGKPLSIELRERNVNRAKAAEETQITDTARNAICEVYAEDLALFRDCAE